MFQIIKKIVLWSYERGTWQYDLMCLAIMAFIFLTPKIWFDSIERKRMNVSQIVIKEESISVEELEKRVKRLSGNEDAKVLQWRQKKDENGKTYYEVDIQ